MDFITILGIAVGLAMDAFSVCIAAGIVIGNPAPRHYFRLSFHFGLFQFLMPLIGYAAGMHVEHLIADYDHWVAMGLLAFIGLKMIKESFTRGREEIARDPSRGWQLVILSVATSIDALAVGLSIGVLGGSILFPSIVIGLVCALFSATGVALGRRVGALFGRRVERIGGVILIAIGVKIVFEHLC